MRLFQAAIRRASGGPVRIIMASRPNRPELAGLAKHRRVGFDLVDEVGDFRSVDLGAEADRARKRDEHQTAAQQSG